MVALPLNEFADNLNQVIPVIMREFSLRQTNELYRGKITLQQFIVLSVLERRGSFKMTELAREMKVTTADISGLVNRLVKGGYIRRVFDPQDRRIIMVRLTPKASRVIENVTEQRRRMIIDIFGRISEAERSDYLRILKHIKQILEEQKRA
jgi:DNA-binding MarR family transcriptional regulator